MSQSPQPPKSPDSGNGVVDNGEGMPDLAKLDHPMTIPRPMSPSQDLVARAKAEVRIDPSEDEKKLLEGSKALELLKTERARVARLEAELQEAKIAAEAREKSLEDELGEAMITIIKCEGEMEDLKAETDKLVKALRTSNFQENVLVENNARGIRTILQKERSLEQAAHEADNQSQYHKAEKRTLQKRIDVLKELRQSLVPGLTDIDSCYWNFGVSLRGIAAARTFDPNISEHGAIKLLINVCLSHPTADVVLSAADALSELAANSKFRKIISDRGAIKPLCDRLNASLESVTSGNADLTQLSMFGLVAFALSRLAINGTIRQEIALKGGIYPMVQLAKHSRNMILMHATCLALANLSYNNSANKSRICSEGGIEALTRVLSQEEEDSVLCQAAKCMANVTCNSVKGQQAAGSGGAVQALVMVAGKKNLSSTTMMAVMAALGNIALNEPVGKPTISACVGIPPMVRFVSKRRCPLIVVINAVRALGNVGYSSQSMKARVMSDKAGPPLCARLAACCTGIYEDLALVTEVCRTVGGLCMNRDNSRVFAGFGILPPVITLLMKAKSMAMEAASAPGLEKTSHHHKDSLEARNPVIIALEAMVMLLSILMMNDEVRDVAIERHGATEALLVGANAFAYLTHEEPLMDCLSAFSAKDEPSKKDHWMRILKEQRYPRWLKVGLMRIAPEKLIDKDALYYLMEEMRDEGELYMKSSVSVEYFTDESVSLTRA
eukprot:g4085.t1